MGGKRMEIPLRGLHQYLIAPRGGGLLLFSLLLWVVTVSAQNVAKEEKLYTPRRSTTNATCPATCDGNYTCNFQISTQQEADSFSGCTLIPGNLEIVQSANVTTLTLNGITEIKGFLNITSCPSLVNISAPDLQSINPGLILIDLPLFEAFDLPQLQGVESIDWENLPSANSLGFSPYTESGVNLLADEMVTFKVINTSLTTLYFGVLVIENMIITGNFYLEEISFDGLGSVLKEMIIADNGGGAVSPAGNINAGQLGTLVLLGALRKVEGMMTVSGVGPQGIRVSVLQEIFGNLTLSDNLMTDIDFLALRTIGGSVLITNNTFLEALGLSTLETISGSLTIESNSLENDTISLEVEFSGLTEVEGSITMEGALSAVYFAAMEEFQGSVIINSTHLPFYCSEADAIHDNTVSKKAENYDYLCRAGQTTDGAKHYSPAKKLSTGARAGIIVGSVLGGLLLFGSFAWFFTRRYLERRKRRTAEDEASGHELPPFRANGLPHEVPPKYEENESTHASSSHERERESQVTGNEDAERSVERDERQSD